MTSGKIKPTLQRDLFAFGFTQICIIDLRVAAGTYLDVAEALSGDPGIMSVTTLIGDYQIRIMAAFQDNDDLERFIFERVYGMPQINSVKFDMCFGIRKYASKLGAIVS